MRKSEILKLIGHYAIPKSHYAKTRINTNAMFIVGHDGGHFISVPSHFANKVTPIKHDYCHLFDFHEWGCDFLDREDFTLIPEKWAVLFQRRGSF